MKSAWDHIYKSAIVVGVLLLAVGLFMVIFPDTSAVTICYLLGTVLIISGAFKLFRYYRYDFSGFIFQYDFTSGICCILIGLLLLIHPTGAVVFLPVAVGFYLMVTGVCDIEIFLQMRKKELGSWMISLIFGIVSIILSTLMFLNPFETGMIFMVFIGIALILNSISIFYAIYSFKKHVKNGRGSDVIDVEWKELDD